MKIRFFLCILIWICRASYGQGFPYQIPFTAKTDGYAIIRLDPKFRSLCEPDYSDIRILDNKGIEQPYFTRLIRGKMNTYDTIKELSIIDISHIKNISTELIISNQQKSILNHLNLIITNTEESKTYTIVGSNDRLRWYSISNGELSDMTNNKGLTTTKSIHFPNCDYTYLKLKLNDSNSAAIQINEVFVSSNTAIWSNSLVEMKNIHFNQKIVGKNQLIEITSPYRYTHNEIVLDIKHQGFFLRQYEIFKKVKIKNRIEEHILSAGELTENKKNISNVSISDSHFFIRIFNEDNPPLSIDHIRFFQNPCYVIAYFKANTRYSLVGGNKDLTPPQYDIRYIQNTISDSLPIIDIPLYEPSSSPVLIETKAFYEQRWFLWSVLVTGCILIIAISISMIHSMKNRN